MSERKCPKCGTRCIRGVMAEKPVRYYYRCSRCGVSGAAKRWEHDAYESFVGLVSPAEIRIFL